MNRMLFMFAAALLPLTGTSAERESLADFFAKRVDKKCEVYYSGRNEWVPAKITRVGSDFICFDAKITSDSPDESKCYPYSSIRRIMDRADVLLVAPQEF